MSFSVGWSFAERHMSAVRDILFGLPLGLFTDIATATPIQDAEQATDLCLSVRGGTLAVRIRRHKFISRASAYFRAAQGLARYPALDWSVRRRTHFGHRTEWDKLLDGFGDWYFYGYSEDDAGALALWWLIDLAKCRSTGVFQDPRWQTHDNLDDSAGSYFPLAGLEELDCIMATNADVVLLADL